MRRAETGGERSIGEQSPRSLARSSTSEIIYDELATQYENRWESYIRVTVDACMERCRPLEALGCPAKVLDVGTGTGALVKAMRARFPRFDVSGVDISENMLDVARTACPGCTFVLGAAEALPFADSSFDAVVSLSSLHFWRDRAAGLREIERVLRPSGVLILTDWCHDYLACKLCAWYLWLTPGHTKEEWSILGTREVLRMLASAGFTDNVDVDVYQIASHMFGNPWLPRWGLMTLVARAAA